MSIESNHHSTKGEAYIVRHNLAGTYNSSALRKIPKKFDDISLHSDITNSSQINTQDRQIISRPDNVSWIRRETLALNQVSPISNVLIIYLDE